MSVLLALVLAAAPAASGSVVVAPPECLSPDSAWLAEGVADVLPRALGRLGVAAVERADRLRAKEALGVPAMAATTRATSIRVAEALEASRLVLGSIELHGSDVSLSLRLLDLQRGTLSAPLIAAGPLEALPGLVHGLAWDIALTAARPSAGSREAFVASAGAVPFPAFRAYAEALASTDPAQRVKRVRRALALAPEFDEARLALGRFLLETREWAGAEEALGRLRPEFPLARTGRFLRGVALLHLGRYREAADLYTALAAGDGDTGAVLNNRALALLRLGGSPPRASAVLRPGVEKDPGAPDLPFNLGWALLLEGDAEASVFWMRGVVRRDPRDNHARLVLSWALSRAGHDAEAADEFRALSAVSSSYQAMQSPDLSRRFERIQLSERVIAADSEGRSDPELAATHCARADRLSEAGDLEGAFAELTRAAYLDPYGARVHRQLARLHRRRDEIDKAAAELRMSLWCRDDPAVRLELAGVLKDSGHPAEAKAEARRVLQADPANDDARRLAELP